MAASVPPAGAVAGRFFGYDQLKRLWYTFFFQTAFAELTVPMDDYAFVGRLWADWSPGYDAAADLDRVRQAIGTAERTLAAITYYRATYDPAYQDPALAEESALWMSPTPRPTLYLHGTDDGCYAMDAFDDPLPFLAEGSEAAYIGGAGHFVHLEQPDEVNARILAFLEA